MNWLKKVGAMLVAAVAFLSGAINAGAQTITNTAAGIYGSVASPFTTYFDALLALAIAILVTLVIYSLVRSWLGRRKGKIG